MGRVKDQLWDWEEDILDEYQRKIDAELFSGSDIDTSDIVVDTVDNSWITDWSATSEATCGIGIDTAWYVDANEEILERGLGADVLQKINKKVKEMGGYIIDDEIPF